jgi:Uma2 family endonuclease
MSVEIAKRSFNVAEYYRMAEAGILTENDHVELIEGEIVEMSPAGSRHASCVKRLTNTLVKRIGHLALISVQDPIDLDEYSEPEPDLALLRPREDFYSNGHPTPRDVLLVIEVADSSEKYDREIKVPLYARAGIPETWVASLLTNVIHQYAQPVNGVYQIHNEFKRGESLTSVRVPELRLTVDEILG